MITVGRGDRDRREGDRGSGTVLALTLVVTAALSVTAVAGLGKAVVVRHRAQAAADLAALAAASGWPSADCSRAAATAFGNGAVLTGCSALDDGSSTVVVRSPIVVLPLSLGAVTVAAGARAGPRAP
jgi:secretion/DNA translocation related TadE-like protein